MAVFTPVNEADVIPLLQRLGLGDLRELVPIAEGVENTNYRLETGAGRHVLTLFERRTDKAGLPFCLGLTAQAANHGLPCARPLQDPDGTCLFELNERPASVLEWLPGAWQPQPTPSQIRTAGAMLAQLHLATASYDLTREDPVGRRARKALFDRCQSADQGPHARMLYRLAPWVDLSLPDAAADLPTGPIHADWFPDNILFDGERITGIIDFYLGCTGALAYDLAVAMSAWGFDASGAPIPKAAQTLQNGYESVRRLTTAERKALPALGAAAAVRFTLTRLHDLIFHDPAHLVTPKDPGAFLRRLDWWEAVT